MRKPCWPKHSEVSSRKSSSLQSEVFRNGKFNHGWLLKHYKTPMEQRVTIRNASKFINEVGSLQNLRKFLQKKHFWPLVSGNFFGKFFNAVIRQAKCRNCTETPPILGDQ